MVLPRLALLRVEVPVSLDEGRTTVVIHTVDGEVGVLRPHD